MDPDSDEFVPMDRVKSSANGYVTLSPEETYRLDGIDYELKMKWEFDENEKLYGIWIHMPPMKLSEITDEDKESIVNGVRSLMAALSDERDILYEGEPVEPKDLTFEYFEQQPSRFFWLGGDGTFCQLIGVANADMDLVSLQVGIGRIDKWPAVAGILKGLTAR